LLPRKQKNRPRPLKNQSQVDAYSGYRIDMTSLVCFLEYLSEERLSLDNSNGILGNSVRRKALLRQL